MNIYIIFGLAIILVISVFTYIKKKRESDSSVPQGIQIFDGSGNITMDVTESLARFYGQFTITTQSGSFTPSIPSTDNGTLFIVVKKGTHKYSCGNSMGYYIRAIPEFTISGHTISWQLMVGEAGEMIGNNYANVPVTVYYGTY